MGGNTAVATWAIAAPVTGLDEVLGLTVAAVGIGLAVGELEVCVPAQLTRSSMATTGQVRTSGQRTARLPVTTQN